MALGVFGGGVLPPADYQSLALAAATVVAANQTVANQLARKMDGVAQRVFGPLLTRVQRALTGLTGRAVQGITNLFSRKPVLASDCFDTLLARFPDIDSTSKAAAQDLCDNVKTELTIRGNLRADGVKAICAALAQNTALTTFTFDLVYCDTEVFAEAMVAALKANKSLRNLALDVLDVTNYMTPAATRTLFEGLPCFSLETLDLGRTTMEMDTAQALRDTLKAHPYFPLKKFSFTWLDPQFDDSKFQVIAEGVGANRCFSEIMFGIYTSATPQKLSSLFQAIGTGGTISAVDLWCPDSVPLRLTDAQQEVIMNATRDNICFRTYTTQPRPLAGCFSDELRAALNNITRGREPCTRNASCDVPPDCRPPTTAPTPAPSTPPTGAPTAAPTPNATDPVAASSSTPITQGVAFPVAVAAAGGVAAVAALLVVRRKRRQDAEQASTVTMTDNIPLHLRSLETRVAKVEGRLDDVEAGRNPGGTASGTSTLNSVRMGYELDAASAAAERNLAALEEENRKAAALQDRQLRMSGTVPGEPAPQPGQEEETLVFEGPVAPAPAPSPAAQLEEVSTAEVQLPEGGNPEDTGDLQPGEAGE